MWVTLWVNPHYFFIFYKNYNLLIRKIITAIPNQTNHHLKKIKDNNISGIYIKKPKQLSNILAAKITINNKIKKCNIEFPLSLNF